MRASLPVLEEIRIASPCSESWDAMSGDDRTRHCAKCNLDVYNLSGLTRAEAQRLLTGREGLEGKMCVRLFKRFDGTVLTQDCPSAMMRMRRRLALAATVAFSLVGLSAVTLASASRTGHGSIGSRTLGAIAGLFVGQLPGFEVMGGAMPDPSMYQPQNVSATYPHSTETTP